MRVGTVTSRQTASRIAIAAWLTLFGVGCSRKPPRPPIDEQFLSAFMERQRLRVESYDRMTPPIHANLLFISIDTTRADHLGCYGADSGASPTIDAFAVESILFENAFTVMPTTLPSHAAIMTSLYPAELGVINNHDSVPAAALTLAERLQNSGFVTAAFVSALPLRAEAGLNQGFATYMTPDSPEAPGDLAVDRATAWIEANHDQRFFAFVHMFDPHTWYSAPESDRAIFDVEAESLPAEREWVKDRAWFTPERVAETRRAYDAEIHYADSQVARLLQTLETNGLADSTIVVLVSDHGETLDEELAVHGYAFDHGEFLNRRELRIPFILHLPAAFALAPARQAELVSTLDLMPTLLELLGAPPRPPMNGQSLVPLLRGQTYVPERIVAQRRDIRRSEGAPITGLEFAVIDANWHWIQSDNRAIELFSNDDPDQRTNVGADHADVVTDFDVYLRRWRTVFGYPIWQPGSARVDPVLKKGLESLGYTGGDDE
ncbi:MAG: sulfatase [Phycisphaerales bacterium]|nr:sulfatase [Phycisphaerales bacterium]